MPQSAPQFVPQQSRSIAESSPYHTDIYQQIHEGKMPTPSGRLQLSSTLGFPDFEPATSDADEDQLSDERLKDGWKGEQRPANFDEFGSMEGFFEDSLEKIQSMRETLGIPGDPDRHRRHRKIRQKSTLFPEPVNNMDSQIISWLARLADPQVRPNFRSGRGVGRLAMLLCRGFLFARDARLHVRAFMGVLGSD